MLPLKFLDDFLCGRIRKRICNYSISISISEIVYCEQHNHLLSVFFGKID